MKPFRVYSTIKTTVYRIHCSLYSKVFYIMRPTAILTVDKLLPSLQDLIAISTVWKKHNSNGSSFSRTLHHLDWEKIQRSLAACFRSLFCCKETYALSSEFKAFGWSCLAFYFHFSFCCFQWNVTVFEGELFRCYCCCLREIPSWNTVVLCTWMNMIIINIQNLWDSLIMYASTNWGSVQ